MKLSPIEVLALAGVAVAIGLGLKRQFLFLNRLHIPAAIVGGLVFVSLNCLLRWRGLNLDADAMLRDVLLIASFTTIGLNTSLRVLRTGGIAVLLMAIFTVLGGVMQA